MIHSISSSETIRLSEKEIIKDILSSFYRNNRPDVCLFTYYFLSYFSLFVFCISEPHNRVRLQQFLPPDTTTQSELLLKTIQ